MKRFICACLSLFFIAEILGQQPKAFKGDWIEVICERPNSEETITLKTAVPVGWKQNPDFGTVVYQPPDADDYFEPPTLEFQAKCEGECSTEAIPKNIEGYIQRLKDGWKTLSTGNAELDKLGTNVEIIKEEQSEGKWLFEVKLTYPDGVSSAMYPPRYYIYRFLHNPQDPFFILIIGKVPVNLADQFLTDVLASCLSSVKL